MNSRGITARFNFTAFRIFAKAQVAAFTGGVSDYLLMIVFTELFTIHYTISIILSGLIGAVVNFSINRYWSFASIERAPIGQQLSKFALVVAGSIVLKSGGTYLITQYMISDYRISRLVAELFVSYFFNYMLLRYWVFKEPVHRKEDLVS